MEIQLGIILEKLVPKVKIAVGRADDIQAFGELWFHLETQEDPIFKVKGFTIRLKEFGGKKVLSVVFPGFRSGKGFQTSFVTEDKGLLDDIRKLFLDEFAQTTGGMNADEVAKLAEEEITDADLDEIAAGIEEQNRNQ